MQQDYLIRTLNVGNKIITDPLGGFYRQQLRKKEEYWERANAIKTLEDIFVALPTDDALDLNRSLHICLFAADLFETYIMKANKHMRKHFGNEAHTNILGNIEVSLKRCSKELALLHKSKSEEYQMLFAEEADKLEEYMEKRIPVFIRKEKRLYDKNKAKQDAEH